MRRATTRGCQLRRRSIANGDAVDSVIASRPAAVPLVRRRAAAFCISHGADEVLPIARCSGAMSPCSTTRALRWEDCEFEGGHNLPADISQDATECSQTRETSADNGYHRHIYLGRAGCRSQWLSK